MNNIETKCYYIFWVVFWAVGTFYTLKNIKENLVKRKFSNGENFKTTNNLVIGSVPKNTDTQNSAYPVYATFLSSVSGFQNNFFKKFLTLFLQLFIVMVTIKHVSEKISQR